MHYRKIHIIGGPGSGKTYSAKRLSEKINIPRFDLDKIFWKQNTNSYGKKTPKGKRKKELNKILDLDSYILEGVYYSWLEKSFKYSDVVFVLNNSVWLRDWRLMKRFIKRKIGIVKSKQESLNDFFNLIKWNHKYDGRNLKKALNMIKKLNENIVFCKSNSDITDFLNI